MFGSGKMSMGPMTLGAETIDGPVGANGRLELNGTKVNGSVHANGSFEATNATIDGDITLNGQGTVKASTIEGDVRGSGLLEVVSSSIEGDVQAQGSLVLQGATVEGDVDVSGPCTLEHSKILGRLTAHTQHLVLDNTVVQDIVLSVHGGNTFSMNVNTGGMNPDLAFDMSNFDPFSGNMGQQINDHVTRVMQQMGNFGSMGMHTTNVSYNDAGNNVYMSASGGSFVQVGPGSHTAMNGYTISANNSDTTTITPDNTTYVNAKRVSGSGPDDYADYQKKYPGAPTIQGPGWSADRPEKAGSASTDTDAQPRTAHLTIELKSGSQVSGNVRFTSHYGKVIVHPGATFTGNVTNGEVERL